jgi:hypothetical protein
MTPREIAIDIKDRAKRLRITLKRLFYEAGVNRHNYIQWRCRGRNPRPRNLARIYATLERYERAQ